MSDLIDDPVVATSANDAELLLYDYFKHLTTLVLVTLGGVLSIAQGASSIDKRDLVVVVVAIALSGAGALHGLDAITKARFLGKPLPRSLRLIRSATSALFSMGIGVFLVIFLQAFT